MRNFLENEGEKLKKDGAAHYYDIRRRFNLDGDPLKFLFLNRACFNGVMRFNKRKEFNTAFCRNPNRFTPQYIDTICNKVADVQRVFAEKNVRLVCADYREIVNGEILSSFFNISVFNIFLFYFDPPYVNRHSSYWCGQWTREKEKEFSKVLLSMAAQNRRIIFSTWGKSYEEKGERINGAGIDFGINGDIVIKKVKHKYCIGQYTGNRMKVDELLVGINLGE